MADGQLPTNAARSALVQMLFASEYKKFSSRTSSRTTLHGTIAPSSVCHHLTAVTHPAHRAARGLETHTFAERSGGERAASPAAPHLR
jgi:hypothetical protein